MTVFRNIVFRINIKSMQKEFQEFFKTLKFNLSAVCFSETWCESLHLTKNSNYRTLCFLRDTLTSYLMK